MAKEEPTTPRTVDIFAQKLSQIANKTSKLPMYIGKRLKTLTF